MEEKMKPLFEEIRERLEKASERQYNFYPSAQHDIARLLKAVDLAVGAMKNSILVEDTCEECGTFKAVRYEITEIKKALAQLKELSDGTL